MARKLAAGVYVYVVDPDGHSCGFGSADDVPDWAAEQITNPAAWADDSATADDGETPATPAADGAPPKAGSGSGLAEWADYARSLGIDVPESASRGDVITLVEAHEQK